jgi:hypothetical protein
VQRGRRQRARGRRSAARRGAQRVARRSSTIFGREIQGRRADRGDSDLHGGRLPAVRRGHATGPVGPREELREGRAVRGRSGEPVGRGGRCARRRRGRVWCTRRSWLYVGGLSAGVTVGMTVLLLIGCDAGTVRRDPRVSEQGDESMEGRKGPRNIRDELLPVALGLELVRIVAAEGGPELRLRYEFG